LGGALLLRLAPRAVGAISRGPSSAVGSSACNSWHCINTAARSVEKKDGTNVAATQLPKPRIKAGTPAKQCARSLTDGAAAADDDKAGNAVEGSRQRLG